MKKSDFRLLRQMHDDLLEALKDLEACQCCVTCYYFTQPGTPEPCRECRHQNRKSRKSNWIWRLSGKTTKVRDGDDE